MSDTVEQPPIPRGRLPGDSIATKTKRFVAGGRKSQVRLQQLYHDPIEELVNKYRTLQKEIGYQEKLRSREIVEMTPSGKERAYRAEVHLKLHEIQIKIASDLLRYGYGRVPELNVVETKALPSLTVNLTKKGEQYVLNDKDPFAEEYEDDEDE